jgi:hypothetical protein
LALPSRTRGCSRRPEPARRERGPGRIRPRDSESAWTRSAQRRVASSSRPVRCAAAPMRRGGCGLPSRLRCGCWCGPRRPTAAARITGCDWPIEATCGISLDLSITRPDAQADTPLQYRLLYTGVTTFDPGCRSKQLPMQHLNFVSSDGNSFEE